MPSAPPSTTPICWSPAWSATARPRPGRWRARGRAFASSTPARDGAVLPILHLNEHKISGPTVLGRRARTRSPQLLAGHGYEPPFVVGGDVAAGPSRDFAAALETRTRGSARSSTPPASGGPRDRPHLAGDRPAHPEGLDRTARGRRGARSRARSAPTRSRSPRSARTPSTWRMLEEWMRSYRPRGALRSRAAASSRARRRSPRTASAEWAQAPHANGGRLLRAARRSPTSTPTRSPIERPGAATARDRPGRSAS